MTREKEQLTEHIRQLQQSQRQLSESINQKRRDEEHLTERIERLKRDEEELRNLIAQRRDHEKAITDRIDRLRHEEREHNLKYAHTLAVQTAGTNASSDENLTDHVEVENNIKLDDVAHNVKQDSISRKKSDSAVVNDFLDSYENIVAGYEDMVASGAMASDDIMVMMKAVNEMNEKSLEMSHKAEALRDAEWTNAQEMRLMKLGSRISQAMNKLSQQNINAGGLSSQETTAANARIAESTLKAVGAIQKSGGDEANIANTILIPPRMRIVYFGSSVLAILIGFTSLYLYAKRDQYALAMALPLLIYPILSGMAFNTAVLQMHLFHNFRIPLIISVVLFIAAFLAHKLLTSLAAWTFFSGLLYSPFYFSGADSRVLAVIALVAGALLAWLFLPVIKTLVVSLFASACIGSAIWPIMASRDIEMALKVSSFAILIVFIGSIYICRRQWIISFTALRNRFRKESIGNKMMEDE